jgi:hypothetical protein
MSKPYHYKRKFDNGYWTLLMVAVCIAVIAASVAYLVMG